MPYRGAAPALTDLLGGQVQAFFADVPVLMPQIKAGKVKPLGAASGQRNPKLPNVPTLAEAGYPDTSSDNWYGLLAPAKTPPAVVAKLNAAFAAAINDPVVKQKLIESGAIPAPNTPAQFGQILKDEIARWGKRGAREGHQGAGLVYRQLEPVSAHERRDRRRSPDRAAASAARARSGSVTRTGRAWSSSALTRCHSLASSLTRTTAPIAPRVQATTDGNAGIHNLLQSVTRPERARLERRDQVLGKARPFHSDPRSLRLTPGVRRPNRPRSAISGVRTFSP